MTWIDDIGQFLSTTGLGTLGTDIFFEGFEPAVPNCIALFGQAGQPPKTTLRKTMILNRPELGIRVRNQDDATASSKADEIYNLLNFIFNTVLGDTRFKSIKALASPFFVTLTESNLYIYSINFALEIG